ncbi:hypothetical protein DERP_007566 [Dermatophagoides pteronyssinus]|uniref:Uncharacterized protein n=1 Tax=Dermatophagoides pteronyssinus TaxID=6956 RepID=A0ABQ8JK39_DERPT|nr:hypothetical protein DERP_007566 [Dermatophagoides pteronyssinus]
MTTGAHEYFFPHSHLGSLVDSIPRHFGDPLSNNHDQNRLIDQNWMAPYSFNDCDND